MNPSNLARAAHVLGPRSPPKGRLAIMLPTRERVAWYTHVAILLLYIGRDATWTKLATRVKTRCTKASACTQVCFIAS